MSLQELIAAADLSAGLVTQIDELVEAKRRTNERANASRLPDVDALIRDELAHAADVVAAPPPPGARDEADRLFLDLVNGAAA